MGGASGMQQTLEVRIPFAVFLVAGIAAGLLPALATSYSFLIGTSLLGVVFLFGVAAASLLLWRSIGRYLHVKRSLLAGGIIALSYPIVAWTVLVPLGGIYHTDEGGVLRPWLPTLALGYVLTGGIQGLFLGLALRVASGTWQARLLAWILVVSATTPLLLLLDHPLGGVFTPTCFGLLSALSGLWLGKASKQELRGDG